MHFASLVPTNSIVIIHRVDQHYCSMIRLVDWSPTHLRGVFNNRGGLAAARSVFMRRRVSRVPSRSQAISQPRRLRRRTASIAVSVESRR